MKARIAKEVHDFAALPIRFPALTSYSVETTHYLYIRANAPRIPTENTPRELFLVNVPVDATETHLRSLFAEQLGGARVEDVGFEDTRVGKGIKAPVVQSSGKRGKKRKRGVEKPTEDGEEGGDEVGLLPEIRDRLLHRSGGTAIVRFVDRASAEMALRATRKAVKTGQKINWGAGVEKTLSPLGSTRYATQHKLRYPDPAVLQASIDAIMTAFSAQEAERAQQLAKQRSVPDEEGFITVTRGGRNGPAREVETKAREEELKKREKDRVKDDFYRFQVREKKKERSQDLVKGFEQDRKRVEEMRKRRGRIRPE